MYLDEILLRVPERFPAAVLLAVLGGAAVLGGVAVLGVVARVRTGRLNERLRVNLKFKSENYRKNSPNVELKCKVKVKTC